MIIKVDKKHSPDRDKIAPKKLISGSGETSLWNAFSDPSDQFHVGHWIRVRLMCLILKMNYA